MRTENNLQQPGRDVNISIMNFNDVAIAKSNPYAEKGIQSRHS